MATDRDTVMESDSRKRPLDGDTDSGVTKRSNPGDNVHFKILIPSIVAGAIIGKGGETIAQKQKETGARIKMSKANDYYPGTTERVCLITGTIEAITQVHNFIVEKVLEKPDPNPKPSEGEMKVIIKILVPNGTAGMIIGKGGNFIKQIKEESGAYVQVSQKSKDISLPERCITVSGGNEVDSNKKAVSMILQKIAEDPQSASCPNISYADVTGPVASANPTGSPFANGSSNRNDNNQMVPANPGQNTGQNNIGTGMSNLNLGAQMGPGGVFAGVNGVNLEQLKASLRGSGYSDQAAQEISAAMCTLSNYGLMGIPGMGMNVGNQGMGGFSVNLGGGTGLGGLNLGGGTFGNANNPGMEGGSMFGPVGSTPAGIGPGNATGSSSLFSTTSTGGNPDTSMFTEYNSVGVFGNNQGFGPSGDGMNQNSFGLGPSLSAGGPFGGGGENPDDKAIKKDMEVPENLVGVILGPGGKGIVELQQMTGTNIQISKKGVFAPGTRNRVVTITGNPESADRAYNLIHSKLQQEEVRRARQNQGPVR